MKIITLHCDYIRFKALKKAVNNAEEIDSKEEVNIKEPLVVLTSIEKEDSESTINELVESVKKISKDLKISNIVIYPYAHLSSNLAPPSTALEYLQKIESLLKKEKLKVTRAPFGYYKSFELKVKGHPLSELSKEFGSNSQDTEEEIDLADLQRKMSKIKMSAKKPPKGLKSNVELGRDLDLYIVSEIIGQGLPLLTPKGTTIKRELERFITDEELKRGYLHTSTPVMAKSDLYKVSGHWQHYKNDMFTFDVRGDKFALRPMTCPFQFVLYKRKPRSYKELPIRYAEIASLFRNEQSGELRGLTRVRQFTLADAHVICTPNQLANEFKSVIELIKYVMETLGVEVWYRFSKWDPKNKDKYSGDPKAWEKAQKAMKEILDNLKIKYKEAEGEAAFYGPKLDLQYKDVYGKEDTLITVQLDFSTAEKFGMTYKDEKNQDRTPMIIHRSSTGATERMISYLLEKTQGALPVWLSPTQVRIISFTDKNTKSVENLKEKLKNENIRVDSDIRSTTVNDKIRDAEIQKIPYIIVIGNKEEESKTLAVRRRGQKPEFGIKELDLIKEIKNKISSRSLN